MPHTSTFLTSQTDVQVSVLESDFLKCNGSSLVLLCFIDSHAMFAQFTAMVLGNIFFPFFCSCWYCKLLWHLEIGHASAVPPSKLWLYSICPSIGRGLPKWKPGPISVWNQCNYICCFASMSCDLNLAHMRRYTVLIKMFLSQYS